MDEPCASLDSARQEQINEILLKNQYDYIIVTEHLGQIGDGIANIRFMVNNNTLSYAIKDHNNEWTELKEGDFPECCVRKIQQSFSPTSSTLILQNTNNSIPGPNIINQNDAN